MSGNVLFMSKMLQCDIELVIFGYLFSIVSSRDSFSLETFIVIVGALFYTNDPLANLSFFFRVLLHSLGSSANLFQLRFYYSIFFVF
jgi:ABC-type multidrug transport system fused ATPase/permease subunit